MQHLKNKIRKRVLPNRCLKRNKFRRKKKFIYGLVIWTCTIFHCGPRTCDSYQSEPLISQNYSNQVPIITGFWQIGANKSICLVQKLNAGVIVSPKVGFRNNNDATIQMKRLSRNLLNRNLDQLFLLFFFGPRKFIIPRCRWSLPRHAFWRATVRHFIASANN